MIAKGEKIIVFILGVIVLFVFLETSLFIVGRIYSRSVIKNNCGNCIAKNNVVILCLGNSFTYGFGAPKGQSYPDQLQDIFKQKIPERPICVINGGVSNLNTSELLNSLEGNIEKFRPSVVVLQTGSPNLWNYYYYSKYLKRKGDNRFLSKFFISILQKSHTYRFFSLLLFLISMRRR